MLGWNWNRAADSKAGDQFLKWLVKDKQATSVDRKHNMPSLRLTLIAPAVWLSGRLNFALKYWTLGIGLALIGVYLSTPLFKQVNREIAMAKMQLDGVALIAHQNEILLQMVALRDELASKNLTSSESQALSINAAIDDLIRKVKSSEEARLAIILGRNWGRARAENTDDNLANRFANFNLAINSLHALSRESARSYHLNLDRDLDAAFDMMANRLPEAIDTAAKQNHVIQWNIDSMSGFAASAQMNLKEAMPALRTGVRQLTEKANALDTQTDSPTVLPEPKGKPADKWLAPEVSLLQQLLSGLMLQQDAVDQVSEAAGTAKKTAKGALNALVTNNLTLGRALLVDSASQAQSILKARVDRLYQDRAYLMWALVGCGLLIAYLLCAFYIGILKSINALSRGTNAFCAGQRNVRIKLKSRDELSLLATNFNAMAQEVERLVQTIEDQNQTRERDLKVLVDALGHKNEELHTVNQRVQEELNLARSVQLAILPQQFPNEPTWSAHACMHPARELGGDFYDCFALPDGRHGVLVADVSGKGVGAAFFMAVSRSVLLDSALSVRAPAQVLALANELLCARNPMDLFVTACYGLFDPQDGSFEFASAGHPPPLVRRHAGLVETLPTTKDMALGVFKDMHYHEHITRLQPGDTLLMYTDGVTEAFSPQEVAYGEERLLSWFAGSSSDGTAVQLVDDLVRDVARFVDGAEASDDLTCLILCSKRAGWRGPRSSY